jgi:glycosyltransferase involved in cell wall biosynthesis
MRIAFVCAHYAPMIGGVEKHVTEIATRLAARGEEVSVLTHAEADRILPARETIDGVEVTRFRVPVPSTNYAASPALWRYLARHAADFDVVHAHGYHALPALQAALSGPGALVFTPHYHGTGHSAFRKLLHPPYRRLGRLIFARAGRTIAVSPPEAKLILSHFPEIEPRLLVIPNGVDRNALDAAQPFADEQERTLVLSAGRLESYKQVDRTIEAIAHLPDAFALCITGDGSARDELRRRAHELGLAGRVRFLGSVPEEELYRWFRTARVYVSMSSNEAMPVTFIECLAAGASVVGSDIPAHRSLVERTSGSIQLVPLDVPADTLAAAIARAAAAVPAPARIDTWDDVAERTLEAYAEAIAASPRAPAAVR